jgi:hypothetical protein
MTDDSVDIVKDMLFLLEENVGNPEGAVPAFREFLMENRLRMMSIRHVSEEESQTLTREDRIRMNVRFLQKLEPYKKRLKMVAKVYKDRPEVLKKMREVIQSLSLNPE